MREKFGGLPQNAYVCLNVSEWPETAPNGGALDSLRKPKPAWIGGLRTAAPTDGTLGAVRPRGPFRAPVERKMTIRAGKHSEKVEENLKKKMPNTTDIAKIEGEVQNRIITLRGQSVLLDSDVAALYGVETRDINKAVRNNPDKFPQGYLFVIEKQELANLRWNYSTTKLTKTRTLPKAFTEKGLYMLATILKGAKAVRTTISIVETFAKMRELTRTMAQMAQTSDAERNAALAQRGGDLLADLFDDGLQTTEKETEIELNFALLKIKHKVKRK